MADESQTFRAINWREVFPFTHIFRAFHVAIHPSKIILGLLLILCLFAGGRLLDSLWPTSSLPYAYDLQRYEDAQLFRFNGVEPIALSAPQSGISGETMALLLGSPGVPVVSESHAGISVVFFSYELVHAAAVIHAASHGDLASAGDSLIRFAFLGPLWLVQNHLVYAILLTGVFLILWSVFGGAIARIAAVHVARDEKISVRQAISFSTSKIVSFVFAPLIPVIIFLLGGLAVAVGALSFYASHAGLLVASFFFFLTLVVGFAMTLTAVGMIGGLNLMYPTIANEGSDSFDAISRSFSYIFTRPWRMIFYSSVALVYGAICYEFLHAFVFVMLKTTHFFAYSWLKGRPASTFAAVWPSPGMHALSHTPNYVALNGFDGVCAAIIAFWIYVLAGLLGTFVISFYFSANTIIYSLLRLEVDATELDDVYFEEDEDEFSDAGVNRPSDTAAVVPLSESAPNPTSDPAVPPSSVP